MRERRRGLVVGVPTADRLHLTGTACPLLLEAKWRGDASPVVSRLQNRVAMTAALPNITLHRDIKITDRPEGP